MVIHQITERDRAQRPGVRAACPQKNSVNRFRNRTRLSCQCSNGNRSQGFSFRIEKSETDQIENHQSYYSLTNSLKALQQRRCR